MNISYTFLNNFSLGFDLGLLWLVLSSIWGAYSQKAWKVEKFSQHSNKRTSAKNKSRSIDLGLFSLFVLNRILHLGIVYVVFKFVSILPISVANPEILATVANGVGGYMGGIAMWIFYLSNSILKELD